jgi:hypothetical protein
MELIVIVVVIGFVFVRLNRRAGSSAVSSERGPLGWVAGSDWRVVRPLARADLRRVLRHPAFLAGVLLTPLMLLPATEYASTWRAASGGIALALIPLGWLTIIATNLVALRPRRTGADELFATLPAPQPVRTTALLATAAGPVVVATGIAAAWVALLSRGSALRGGELSGSPEWKEIAVGVLIVAGSVCVGVSVARWLQHAGFGVLAAIATLILNVRFLDVTTWPWSRSDGDPMRFLAFHVEDASTGTEFLELRPAGWHLLYVGGLVVVMGAVALARDGLRRSIGVVLGAALLVTAGAGWMQTRPPSAAQESEMVAALVDPAAHHVCEESAGVHYCAYPEFVNDVPEWRHVVETTMALLPDTIEQGRAPLAVRQRPPMIKGDHDCTALRFEETLPPGVAARLSPASLWPADRDVPPSFAEETFPCDDRDVHGFFLAVQTGAWGVGLPSAPHDDYVRCTANGQARAVIALWAGAAASPDGATTLLDVTPDGWQAGDRLTFDDWIDPPIWGVEYAAADAALAHTMLAMPAADVRAVLEADWARWTDSATSASDLAAELGVPARRGAASPTSVICP